MVQKQSLLSAQLQYPSEEFEHWIAAMRGGGAWRSPDEVSQGVAEILDDVRQRGDAALVDWTNRLDNRNISSAAELLVPADRLERALAGLSSLLRDALTLAKERIEACHKAERAERRSWQFNDQLGVSQGRILRPVRAAGFYVPGGRASYPSSVLMNCVPAQVAGVAQKQVCTPWPDGEASEVALAAMQLAGVDAVYTLGGAVAVAAMAFGTETVPATDVVVGPGNIWVAEAKRQLFGTVGLDMLAGPSEVVVIADERAKPAWVAADMCAQAEHDPQARAILISDCRDLIEAVSEELAGTVGELDRSEIVTESLRTCGASILVPNLNQAVEVANRIAPEHLQLAVNRPGELLEQVECAGAVFLGHATSEVLGDYIAGSNHVLPTGGTARFSSPLGVSSFMTEIAFVECSSAAASDLAIPAIALAQAEGLTAHARAASWRNRRPADGPEPTAAADKTVKGRGAAEPSAA